MKKETNLWKTFALRITDVIKGRHVVLAVVVAGLSAMAVAAVLTPGTGILSAPVFARASFADRTDIKFKIKNGNKEVINVDDAQQTVVQQIVLGPGGHTGWHSHPGPVVVLVKSGTISFYDGDDPACTGRTYTAGQAFIDSGQGHAHIARNESTTDNLELWATYFDVPPPPPPPASQSNFRIDVPNPGNCSF
jgi:quercetin dioxygenase-like cupin family protein